MEKDDSVSQIAISRRRGINRACGVAAGRGGYAVMCKLKRRKGLTDQELRVAKLLDSLRNDVL